MNVNIITNVLKIGLDRSIQPVTVSVRSDQLDRIGIEPGLDRLNRSVQLIFFFFKQHQNDVALMLEASKRRRFGVLNLQPPKSNPSLLPPQQLPLHPSSMRYGPRYPINSCRQPLQDDNPPCRHLFQSSQFPIMALEADIGNPFLPLEAWKPPRLTGTLPPPGCKHPTPPGRL